MVHFISRWLTPCALPAALLAGFCSSTLTAQAQSASPTATPDPLDPKASTPTLVYESAFSQYRRLGDEKPVPWREANDTVTRIGGWRVYAREATQPESPTDSSGAKATSPRPVPVYPDKAIPPAARRQQTK